MANDQPKKVFLRGLPEHFEAFCEKRTEEILLTLEHEEEPLPELEDVLDSMNAVWDLIGDKEKAPELWIAFNALEHELGLKQFALCMAAYRQGVLDGIEMALRMTERREAQPEVIP